MNRNNESTINGLIAHHLPIQDNNSILNCTILSKAVVPYKFNPYRYINPMVYPIMITWDDILDYVRANYSINSSMCVLEPKVFDFEPIESYCKELFWKPYNITQCHLNNVRKLPIYDVKKSRSGNLSNDFLHHRQSRSYSKDPVENRIFLKLERLSKVRLAGLDVFVETPSAHKVLNDIFQELYEIDCKFPRALRTVIQFGRAGIKKEEIIIRAFNAPLVAKDTQAIIYYGDFSIQKIHLQTHNQYHCIYNTIHELTHATLRLANPYLVHKNGLQFYETRLKKAFYTDYWNYKRIRNILNSIEKKIAREIYILPIKYYPKRDWCAERLCFSIQNMVRHSSALKRVAPNFYRVVNGYALAEALNNYVTQQPWGLFYDYKAATPCKALSNHIWKRPLHQASRVLTAPLISNARSEIELITTPWRDPITMGRRLPWYRRPNYRNLFQLPVKAAIPALIGWDIYLRYQYEFNQHLNFRQAAVHVAAGAIIDNLKYLGTAACTGVWPAIGILTFLETGCHAANALRNVTVDDIINDRQYFQENILAQGFSPYVEAAMMKAFDNGEPWTRENYRLSAELGKAVRDNVFQPIYDVTTELKRVYADYITEALNLIYNHPLVLFPYMPSISHGDETTVPNQDSNNPVSGILNCDNVKNTPLPEVDDTDQSSMPVVNENSNKPEGGNSESTSLASENTIVIDENHEKDAYQLTSTETENNEDTVGYSSEFLVDNFGISDFTVDGNLVTCSLLPHSPLYFLLESRGRQQNWFNNVKGELVENILHCGGSGLKITMPIQDKCKDDNRNDNSDLEVTLFIGGSQAILQFHVISGSEYYAMLAGGGVTVMVALVSYEATKAISKLLRRKTEKKLRAYLNQSLSSYKKNSLLIKELSEFLFELDGDVHKKLEAIENTIQTISESLIKENNASEYAKKNNRSVEYHDKFKAAYKNYLNELRKLRDKIAFNIAVCDLLNTQKNASAAELEILAKGLMKKTGGQFEPVHLGGIHGIKLLLCQYLKIFLKAGDIESANNLLNAIVPIEKHANDLPELIIDDCVSLNDKQETAKYEVDKALQDVNDLFQQNANKEEIVNALKALIKGLKKLNRLLSNQSVVKQNAKAYMSMIQKVLISLKNDNLNIVDYDMKLLFDILGRCEGNFKKFIIDLCGEINSHAENPVLKVIICELIDDTIYAGDLHLALWISERYKENVTEEQQKDAVHYYNSIKLLLKEHQNAHKIELQEKLKSLYSKLRQLKKEQKRKSDDSNQIDEEEQAKIHDEIESVIKNIDVITKFYLWTIGVDIQGGYYGSAAQGYFFLAEQAITEEEKTSYQVVAKECRYQFIIQLRNIQYKHAFNTIDTISRHSHPYLKTVMKFANNGVECFALVDPNIIGTAIAGIEEYFRKGEILLTGPHLKNMFIKYGSDLMDFKSINGCFVKAQLLQKILKFVSLEDAAFYFFNGDLFTTETKSEIKKSREEWSSKLSTYITYFTFLQNICSGVKHFCYNSQVSVACIGLIDNASQLCIHYGFDKYYKDCKEWLLPETHWKKNLTCDLTSDALSVVTAYTVCKRYKYKNSSLNKVIGGVMSIISLKFILKYFVFRVDVKESQREALIQRMIDLDYYITLQKFIKQIYNNDCHLYLVEPPKKALSSIIKNGGFIILKQKKEYFLFSEYAKFHGLDTDGNFSYSNWLFPIAYKAKIKVAAKDEWEKLPWDANNRAPIIIDRKSSDRANVFGLMFSLIKVNMSDLSYKEDKDHHTNFKVASENIEKCIQERASTYKKILEENFGLEYTEDQTQLNTGRYYLLQSTVEKHFDNKRYDEVRMLTELVESKSSKNVKEYFYMNDTYKIPPHLAWHLVRMRLLIYLTDDKRKLLDFYDEYQKYTKSIEESAKKDLVWYHDNWGEVQKQFKELVYEVINQIAAIIRKSLEPQLKYFDKLRYHNTHTNGNSSFASSIDRQYNKVEKLINSYLSLTNRKYSFFEMDNVPESLHQPRVTLLRDAVASRKWKAAITLFEHMPRPERSDVALMKSMDSSNNSLLNAVGKCGNWKTVMALFRLVPESKRVDVAKVRNRDEDKFNLVRAALKAREFQVVIDLLKLIREAERLDVFLQECSWGYNSFHPTAYFASKGYWSALLGLFPKDEKLFNALMKKSSRCGNTAIQICALNGKTEGLRTLFEFISDPQIRLGALKENNKNGNNALHIAVMEKKWNCACAILELHPENEQSDALKVKNRNGKTALSLATKSGKQEIFNAILTQSQDTRLRCLDEKNPCLASGSVPSPLAHQPVFPYGLQSYPVPFSVGDCLFTAVAKFVSHHTATQLRSQAVREMRNNLELYRDFIEKDGQVMMQKNRINYVGLEVYLNLMAQPGTWAGHIEIQALSNALQRPIVILRTDEETVRLNNMFGWKKYGLANAIFLAYQVGGKAELGHYEPIKISNDQSIQELLSQIISDAHQPGEVVDGMMHVAGLLTASGVSFANVQPVPERRPWSNHCTDNIGHLRHRTSKVVEIL